MKIEFTINAPAIDENKMTDYLRIFAEMMLVAEDETITDVKVNGEEVNPY